ncbi:MAG: phosphatase PAP2 family protein [Candidatus Omnitrophica bacterium]|nr:phosphatase PAP2 family protein [Candidatus Omnitrophota bacterium]
MLWDADVRLFYLLNSGFINPFFDLIMPFVSALATGEFLALVGMVLFVSRKKEYKTAGLLLLAGLTLSYNIVFILKYLIARPRPYMFLAGVHLLAESDGPSLPSAHTVMAFMAATVIAPAVKRYVAVIVFILAAIAGFSRIYLGVHFPLDVLAGAVIGCTLGYILIRIWENTGFSLKE